MGQLVPDDCADSAEVHGIIESVVVEGWLQDARREIDVIARGIVVSVNRGGRCKPFGGIHRLADLVYLAKELEGAGAIQIAYRITAQNVHRAVITRSEEHTSELQS